jgi:hypothetical protein
VECEAAANEILSQSAEDLNIRTELEDFPPAAENKDVRAVGDNLWNSS